jgi:hypothetical protein
MSDRQTTGENGVKKVSDSDQNLTRVRATGVDPFERLLRAIQTVGFPIVVAGFLLWEWHSVVRSLQDTMTEVKLLLLEVRHEIKSGK